jgi:hypothetical protein
MPLGRSRKLSGTHQLMVYADDANLLGDNTNTIKERTEALTDACKEGGLKVKVKKCKYMLTSRHKMQAKFIKKNYSKRGKFKYFGARVTNQNLIHKEQVEFRQCSLPFTSEPFVFSSVV